MRTIAITILFTASGLLFSSGMIKGIVVSTEDQPLTEANITVIGTTLGSATDDTGKFVIRGVKAGRYILRCSHIGYSDDFVRGVVVEKDSVAVVDFVLEPTEYQLQAIEVDKQMDDLDAMMKTRDLSAAVLIGEQHVVMPGPKGKIRVDTRVGFWERFRHFFHKLFN